MSVLSAANLWESEGVIRSEYVNGKRMLTLNPDFQVASELRSLINALIDSLNAISPGLFSTIHRHVCMGHQSLRI